MTPLCAPTTTALPKRRRPPSPRTCAARTDKQPSAQRRPCPTAQVPPIARRRSPEDPWRPPTAGPSPPGGDVTHCRRQGVAGRAAGWRAIAQPICAPRDEDSRSELAPLLLGSGIPFFGAFAHPPVLLDDPGVVEGSCVTHLRFRAEGEPSPGWWRRRPGPRAGWGRGRDGAAWAREGQGGRLCRRRLRGPRPNRPGACGQECGQAGERAERRCGRLRETAAGCGAACHGGRPERGVPRAVPVDRRRRQRAGQRRPRAPRTGCGYPPGLSSPGLSSSSGAAPPPSRRRPSWPSTGCPPWGPPPAPGSGSRPDTSSSGCP